MTGEPTDAEREVRDALSTAVNSYGRRVLSDPRVLGNLVTDLLPDFPRERSLLVTAAEAGVAADLTENVEGQRMDADTAVALAARSLVENRSLDPAASTWVATEYARALGYQMRSQEAPAWGTPLPQPPGHQPGYEPTMTAISSPGAWPSVTPPAATPPAAASSSSGSESPPTSNPSPGDAPTIAPGANPWSAPAAAASPWAAPANQWPSTPPAAAPANQWAPNPPAAPPASPWSPNPAPPTAPAGYGPPSYGSGAAGASGPGLGGQGQDAQGPGFGGQAYGQPGGQVPPGPGGPGAWPQAGVPPQAGGPWPSSAPPPRNPRRGRLVGGGVVLAIVVLYFIAAAATHVFPFAKKANSTPTPVAAGSSPAVSTPASSPAVTPSSPGASPSPTTSLAAGVKPLKVLMPYDLTDLTNECKQQQNIPWTNPGLASALECQAPDLPDGQVFGYQLDSDADYQKAWANYNKWAEFGTSKTLDCPPGSGNSQGGPNGWYGPRFPKHTGQVLECFTSDSGPVYVWTYPTEDAFMVAQPPKSWSFSKLETWWENNAV